MDQLDSKVNFVHWRKTWFITMESVKWNDDDGMCNVNGWSSQNPFITVMLVKVAWFQELVFILEKCTSEEAHFLKIVLHRICGPADLRTCESADLRICGPADLNFWKFQKWFSEPVWSAVYWQGCKILKLCQIFFFPIVYSLIGALLLAPLLLGAHLTWGQWQESIAQFLSWKVNLFKDPLQDFMFVLRRTKIRSVEDKCECSQGGLLLVL